MISNSNSVGGALPGLTLKAWAQFSAAGALVKGYNVTSITKGAAGLYALNLTSNNTTTTPVIRITATPVNGAQTNVAGATMQGWKNTTTVSSVGFGIGWNGVLLDIDGFIEVYE